MNQDIRIAAAIILNRQGRMLMVRKRGTRFFMQPGGKIDAGETPLQALIRELREELALDLSPGLFRAHGSFSDRAANEDGHTVTAQLFSAFLDLDPEPQAEIEAILWQPLDLAPQVPVAPLSLNHVLPLARNLWRDRSGVSA